MKTTEKTAKAETLSTAQTNLLVLLKNRVLFIDWINSCTQGYCYRNLGSHISFSVPQATAKALIRKGYLYEQESEEWVLSATGRQALAAHEASH